MAEQVCRSPQQFDAGLLLLLLELRSDSVEVGVRFLERRPVRRDVAIVPAVVGGSELRHELERHVDPIERVLDRIGSVVPGAVQCWRAERVRTGPAEGVPVADGEPEQVLHRLAFDHLIRVVVLEGEIVLAVRPLVLDLRDFGEVVGHGAVSTVSEGSAEGGRCFECIAASRATKAAEHHPGTPCVRHESRWNPEPPSPPRSMSFIRLCEVAGEHRGRRAGARGCRVDSRSRTVRSPLIRPLATFSPRITSILSSASIRGEKRSPDCRDAHPSTPAAASSRRARLADARTRVSALTPLHFNPLPTSGQEPPTRHHASHSHIDRHRHPRAVQSPLQMRAEPPRQRQPQGKGRDQRHH